MKDIALCTTAKRRAHIVEMEDEHGHKHSDQDGIAEVFASFHEKLYTGQKTVKGPDTARTQLQPFTQKELTEALTKMSKGKAADDSGIVAEMLKQGNSALVDAILNLFNDIVVGGQGIPSRWKKARASQSYSRKVMPSFLPTTDRLQSHQSSTNFLAECSYAAAISRSSSVSRWLQQRRPFVESDFDHGVVQRMALGALAWAHRF